VTHPSNEIQDPVTQEIKQNISIFVENPFECLASFYFPEHLELSSNSEGVESDKKVKVNIEQDHKNVSDFISFDDKTKCIEIQIAKEDGSPGYKNNEPFWVTESDQNQVLTKSETKSEYVNHVPELVKILQQNSQKKIILEERE
jgi:hypothetical protein